METQAFAITTFQLQNSTPELSAACLVQYYANGVRETEKLSIEDFARGRAEFALCEIKKPRIEKTDEKTTIILFQEQLAQAQTWQNNNYTISTFLPGE